MSIVCHLICHLDQSNALGFSRLNPWRRPDPLLRVNMLAVGDGSCYVVRFALPEAADGRDSHVLMFDCGSLAYLDMGIKTVRPALCRLGVDRIDTLVLSHADLDHFCGVLDVMDHVPVGRVLAPPQLWAAAQNLPGAGQTAASVLVDQLRRRAVPSEAVSQGWRSAIGSARLQILWPPADFVAARANDTSLVLSIRVRTQTGRVLRHVLLNADIQEQAITALMDSGIDLRADVCDLPHHGSFVNVSVPWLNAVSPRAVLQSCGRGRLDSDPWARH